MKSLTGLSAVFLAVALLITGCDQMSGAKPQALVVDLTAVGKATGQDESMQEKAQATRDELNVQLTNSARNLEKLIEEEREKLGGSPSEEQEQILQSLLQQAQQQYAQLQADAQQRAQQNEVNLVLQFRDRVRPIAEKIAGSRGASVVLTSDQAVFWVDPAVDITGDVITELRAQGIFTEIDDETVGDLDIDANTGGDQAPMADEPGAAQ